MTTFLARTDREHIPQLDGVRGVAILLVLAYHYCAFSIGWIGVDLFFVLSGFLITGKLIETRGRPHYLAKFYLRRLLRILPLYFLVCLLFFWLIPLVRPAVVTPSWKELIQLQGWYWSFSINIYNALHGWTNNIGLVHFWSLACEMQFYLCWPLLVWGFSGKRQQLIYFLWACIVFALLFRICAGIWLPLHPIYKYVLLPSRLDAFATGAMLYLYVVNAEARIKATLAKGWWLSVVCLAAAMVLVASGVARWKLDDAATGNWGYTLNALCWGGLMATALSGTGSLPKMMGWRPLRLAGKYSYGIYVFHQPIKFAMADAAKKAGSDANGYWILLLAFLLTVLLAVGSYELFEKRFLRFQPFAQ